LLIIGGLVETSLITEEGKTVSEDIDGVVCETGAETGKVL